MRMTLATAALLVAVPLAVAEDWPQFLGPRRDGTSGETGLVTAWGKDGPPALWQRAVGEGFSGPVVAGDRLVVFHRVEDEDVVECLETVTGKPRWKFAYPTAYSDPLNKGNGPRSTPTIAGDRVLTLGAQGVLHCLSLDKGAKVWVRDLVKDYRVPSSYFGVGTSPVVEGELVLVNVGGKAAGIVAFDLATGKEAWKATADGASYASPVVTTVGGRRLAVFFTRDGVVLLDAKTGDVTHKQRWRARYDASVNAATPLVVGDLAFFSTCYETGGLLLKLRPDGKADELWSDDETMSNHFSTCAYQGGHLYGFHGRQESGPSFRCVELKTRNVRWDQPRFGCGSMVLAEGKLIVLTEAGDLLLVDTTPDAYRELARARVFREGPCRAQIALAGGRLLARDQAKLACFDLKK